MTSAAAAVAQPGDPGAAKAHWQRRGAAGQQRLAAADSPPARRATAAAMRAPGASVTFLMETAARVQNWLY